MVFQSAKLSFRFAYLGLLCIQGMTIHIQDSLTAVAPGETPPLALHLLVKYGKRNGPVLLLVTSFYFHFFLFSAKERLGNALFQVNNHGMSSYDPE